MILFESCPSDFSENNLLLGRLIGASKSLYIKNNPDGKPVFNANIISKTANKKVWYGDLDLAKDGKTLQEIANKIGDLAVLYEFNGRFENENITWEEARRKALAVFVQMKPKASARNV